MDRKLGQPTFLKAALGYAKLGLRVLPVRKQSKCPVQSGWYEKATTDLATIKMWPNSWRAGNLGIATGNGIIAVDIDPRHGGDESLQRLLDEQGPFPATAEAITGSDGRHYLFRVPSDHPISQRIGWKPGIDLIAQAGYIVVEPSIHPDTNKCYRWKRHPGEGIAEAPAWLIQASSQRESKRVATKPTTPSKQKRNGDVRTLVDEMMAKFAIPGPGHRYNLMVRAVGSLMGRRYEDELVVSVMMEWWERFHLQRKTLTDRDGMASELGACIDSTNRNDKFVYGTGDEEHQAHCRKIHLDDEQRRLIKPVHPCSIDCKRGSKLPKLAPPTSLGVTAIGENLCYSDDEAIFVESMIVHVTHNRLNLKRVGIKMTDEQIRQIAKDRRNSDWRPWDNSQMERLKSKYFARPNKPAGRFELVKSISTGQRGIKGSPGSPSEYETTGIELLLKPEARRPRNQLAL